MNLSKYFIRQKDQADCGVACLASIIKYYGGAASLEQLRAMSGTSSTGTTLLGLFQTANEIGLKAGAFEADIENLIKQDHPCILHVVIDEKLQHYIVYYGYHAKRKALQFMDPARGVVAYTEEELATIWKSGALLLVEPGTMQSQFQESQQTKWRWIKSLITEDINLLMVALALGVVIATLGLSTAIFSQKLIDDILPSKDNYGLITGLTLLTLLLISRSGLSYLRQFFLLKQGREFNVRLIGSFFGSLLQLPMSFFSTRKIGDMIARMNDAQRIQQTTIFLTSNLMIDLLMVIIGISGIFFYSSTAGLVALAGLPVYGWIIFQYHPRITRAQKNVMQAYARNESFYIDSIRGIGEIKLFNKETVFTNLVRKVYDLFQESVQNLGKVKVGFSALSEVVSTVFIVVIMGWSSSLVLSDVLSIGALMAILQMMGVVMPAAGNLALTNIYLQEARIAIDRLHEYTDIKPEESGNEDTEAPHLDSVEFCSVSFRFPGSAPLFSDLSLNVAKGESIAILGESGSGKTTALQLIQKFYKPTSGTITYNGISIQEISTPSLRDRLGVVSQEIKLFNGTVLENILIGEELEEMQEKINYLQKIGLADLFKSFPQGLATIVGEEGVSLSGGQKQLLGFARALSKRPELLLLDEATAAMDRDTEKKILAILDKINDECAIITLTHRVNIAAMVDRIYILENRNFQQSGTPAELLIEENLYSKGWNDLLPDSLVNEELP